RAAPGRHRAGPRARGAARAGRLDGRGQRAPEPGRDADQGVRMEPGDQDLRAVTRRQFFRETGFGIGTLALAALLERTLAPAPPTGERAPAGGPLAPRPPHFAPRAKSIIYLFMAGGPSQIDLFDPKPKLAALNGQKIPEEFIKDQRFAFIKGVPRLLGSPYDFRQHGQSGAQLSGLLPNLAGVVDDVAILRSMHTDHFNHGPAQIFMNSGHQVIGRPSMGSWLTYGLGSVNSDLPGFVVLLSGRPDPGAGNACWSNGFLPTAYQGVEFRPKGDPVLSVSSPDGLAPPAPRRSLDTLQRLNERHLRAVGDAEIESRIAAYETAFRMQTSVPELADVSREPPAIHALYGTEPGRASFANNCLLARRLVERG